MKIYLNPNTYLKIAVVILVLDFYAFQKTLPIFIEWLLCFTPFVLLAIMSFLWAYHKQFPFFRNPIFPYIDFTDDKSKVFHAILLGLVFTVFAIMITDSFFQK